MSPRKPKQGAKGTRGAAGGGKGKGKGGGAERGRASRAGGSERGRSSGGDRARSAGAARGRPARGRGDGRSASGHQRRPDGLGGDQVEGRHAVQELLLAGTRKAHEVFVLAREDGRPDDLAELAAQLRVPVTELGRGKFAAMARTEAPQGVVAKARPLVDLGLHELLEKRIGTPFLLATDGVTDPGNLGALLRTAESAGVTGVVLPRHRAVHVTPAVTKSAAGAIEHLRFATVGGLPAAIAEMQEAGVLVLGLDMGGDAELHDLPPLDGPVALVVGAEGQGLSRLVAQRCDVVASIPMVGRTESLNVSVAGGLALYEVVRHRRASGR